MATRNRNLFLTKTLLGVYISLLSFFVEIAPNVENILTRRATTERDRSDIKDAIAIVLALSGAITTAIGRYQAGGVYTPKGLPGGDRET